MALGGGAVAAEVRSDGGVWVDMPLEVRAGLELEGCVRAGSGGPWGCVGLPAAVCGKTDPWVNVTYE